MRMCLRFKQRQVSPHYYLQDLAVGDVSKNVPYVLFRKDIRFQSVESIQANWYKAEEEGSIINEAAFDWSMLESNDFKPYEASDSQVEALNDIPVADAKDEMEEG